MNEIYSLITRPVSHACSWLFISRHSNQPIGIARGWMTAWDGCTVWGHRTWQSWQHDKSDYGKERLFEKCERKSGRKKKYINTQQSTCFADKNYIKWSFPVSLILFLLETSKMIMRLCVSRRMKHLVHILLLSVVNTAWISKENDVTIN